MEVPDDTGEAQVIRQEAQNEMYELNLQAGEVDSIMRKLVRRREQNHFGRDLSVTFRPRGAR
ncbi:hypothetical protein JD276_13995 [Leucobacter sp. CSA1]|uniref:Uncharacterized protein n=1 Tax=Leucobacter chromiisoli TaxID=2796471 RepID=A0A934QA73_9MICO|nr:hypothetical protein [Leucobacter chromiisoli]MBK0420145.1 hypothetical protein [Leucobacter chromiisoli]